MKTKRTKEEKASYYRKLQERWQNIKAKLTEEEIDEIEAVIATHGLNISPISYAIVSEEMRYRNLDGIPYLDCKTYKGWREAGFAVQRGQKSHIKGMIWKQIVKKEMDTQTGLEKELNKFSLPAEYHLFHRSQVRAIA